MCIGDIFISIYIQIYICVCDCACIYIEAKSLYMCVYACIHRHMHIYMYMYIHKYGYGHIYMEIFKLLLCIYEDTPAPTSSVHMHIHRNVFKCLLRNWFPSFLTLLSYNFLRLRLTCLLYRELKAAMRLWGLAGRVCFKALWLIKAAGSTLQLWGGETLHALEKTVCVTRVINF